MRVYKDKRKTRERERMRERAIVKERERKKNILIKKKSGRERVTMVVIYDRFVFFSVEKFFIPLLYSCLNILVQRSCASACL